VRFAKFIHDLLGIVGLAVIVGLLIVGIAGNWATFFLILGVDLLAGLVTRFTVPRDQRLQLLERVRPSAAKRDR
jgi:hypothetical protein